MSNKLYIGARGNSHTIVLAESNRILEFNREDESDEGIVGNIYKGRVENVVAGMNAAFVYIGRERNAYLFCGEQVFSSKVLNGELKIPSPQVDVKIGDEIMVQVSKTETGTKGARISANVSVAGRYLVYMPFVDFIGISRKIEDEEKRKELEELIAKNKTSGGYIIRTNSKDASHEDILLDIEFLNKEWEKVNESYAKVAPGELAYADGDILLRSIRDLVSIETQEIVVDNKEDFESIENAVNHIAHKPKLTLFNKESKDMFYENGLSSAVLSILDKKVVLKSGAYLIIEPTEALTVIDVNTGRYVGATNLEETVFDTNMEAAKAIASQLRLRKIGGIIVVDFIDMEEEEHKKAVLDLLAEEFKKDRVKTTLIGMSPLGLVEITRTKTQKELSQKFSTPCPYCGGRGTIVKFEVLMSFVQTKLFGIFKQAEVKGVLISLAPEVYEAFLEARAFSLEISLYWTDKRIYITKDEKLNVQQYEIEKFTDGVFELPQGSTLLA